MRRAAKGRAIRGCTVGGDTDVSMRATPEDLI